jgi:hypothetical protein
MDNRERCNKALTRIEAAEKLIGRVLELVEAVEAELSQARCVLRVKGVQKVHLPGGVSMERPGGYEPPRPDGVEFR